MKNFVIHRPVATILLFLSGTFATVAVLRVVIPGLPIEGIGLVLAAAPAAGAAVLLTV